MKPEANKRMNEALEKYKECFKYFHSLGFIGGMLVVIFAGPLVITALVHLYFIWFAYEFGG